VVGARGKGGFAGLRLGGVAAQVLHLASCPTLLVRGSRRLDRPYGWGRVVVGFDTRDGFSDRQLGKIGFAVSEARIRQVPLEVAVVRFGLSRLRRPTNSPDLDVHQAEKAIASVLLDEVDIKGIELAVKIRTGNAAGQLGALGRDADLLVIGSGSGGLVPGTIRDQLVHYATCPVALYKHRPLEPAAEAREHVSRGH